MLEGDLLSRKVLNSSENRYGVFRFSKFKLKKFTTGSHESQVKLLLEFSAMLYFKDSKLYISKLEPLSLFAVILKHAILRIKNKRRNSSTLSDKDFPRAIVSSPKSS